MIESFITVHYVMGFFLIVFTTLMVFSFFTSLIRRVFDLLDEIVVGHYTSKGETTHTFLKVEVMKTQKKTKGVAKHEFSSEREVVVNEQVIEQRTN